MPVAICAGCELPLKLRRSARRFGLTERQQFVMLFLAQGDKYSLVAEKMGISERGVRFHVSNIFRKIGAQNSLAALWKLVFV